MFWLWCLPILSAIAESGRFRGEWVRGRRYAVANAVYNLEHQRDGHPAAGRRREHVGGASSLDALRRYAVYADAVRPAVRRRRRRI